MGGREGGIGQPNYLAREKGGQGRSGICGGKEREEGERGMDRREKS